MRNIFHLNASEEHDDFYDLIGTEVTFASQIFTIGGQIMHEQGEKATVADVIYNKGHYYRTLPDIWVKPEIALFKLAGIYGHWQPEAFLEYRNKSSLIK